MNPYLCRLLRMGGAPSKADDALMTAYDLLKSLSAGPGVAGVPRRDGNRAAGRRPVGS
jgi:hypothetical protein